ncbi:MAG TPA: alpha-1,4-glucan--maltose-1-phosphate maltosyltransferase [Gemmatimonadaceae bacterium]|jgi:starch synthase (maltosyl-transferring)
MPQKKTDRRAKPARIEYLLIECITPELDAGRYPVKRVVGDVVEVGADIIKEGHDLVSARVLFKGPDDDDWHSSPLTFDFDSDRWTGSFAVAQIGRWTFTVEAWTDRFGTWRSDLKKKVAAGQDVQLELLEGAQFARTASKATRDAAARASLLMTAKLLEDRREIDIDKRVQRALDDDLLALIEEHFKPTDLTRYRYELGITVDRERARFASWYEIFPRSATGPEAPRAPQLSDRADDGSLNTEPPPHGTFRTAATHLPRIAQMGFDVVYLPPIHPIGHTFRKGKNNSLTTEPDDVGSPWAIGNENGGHDAIEPALGTIDDFDHFVATAAKLRMEIALDYALQCSPDHPWVKEHPAWFHIRPDGSIKYAENPPKKYQDIVPINFWCDDREGLWNACRDVLLYWAQHGVKTFRVDNPHTKAFAFWEWVIAEVQREHPDAVFFAEAFTRPKRMKALAKLGFTMSYTYFTWKNHWWDLVPYAEELTQTEMAEYYRGNFFANTPDILNEYLVDGGRPAFRIRLLLAATLLPLYGIYSGYELCENVPVREGSEEYLDSEKYQLRPRDYDQPHNINADVVRINEIRRQQAALQLYNNLTFHESDNPDVLFYRKALDGQDVLVVATTNATEPQESMVHVPLEELGLVDGEAYVVHDLLTGARYTWNGVRNYVRIDPNIEPGHVFVIEKPVPSSGAQ